MKMMENPDKTKVVAIRESLVLSGGYCPCSFLKNDDTKCPCKGFREKHKCKCGLYVEAKE